MGWRDGSVTVEKWDVPTLLLRTEGRQQQRNAVVHGTAIHIHVHIHIAPF